MTNSIAKYPAYKDSGEYWIEEIPEHWEVKKLKLLFYEKKIKHNPELSCGAISFGNVVTKDDEKIPFSTKASYQEVLKGEFLINPLNLNYDLISLRIALSYIDVVVSSGYIVLKNIADLNKEYFKYLLHRYDVAYMKLLGSGVRQTISFNHIANSLLIFPPLREQQAISEFLDRKTALIDQAIGIKEKQIDLLKERRQILIHQAVTRGLNPNVKMKDSGVEWIGHMPEGWEVKKIKYISQVLRGKFTHRPRNDPRFYDGKYPFIQTGDVSATTKYIDRYSQTLNARGFNVSKEFPKNTIVLTITGSNTGEVAILKFNACFPDSIVGFYPIEGIDLQYFYYSLYALRDTLLKSSTISTQMNLNLEKVSSQYIAFPDFKNQKEISAVIIKLEEKMFDLINKHHQEIKNLQEYKASLINSAVTGKIKVG
jgi:type I restriction enzyme, S subunit